MIYSVYSLVKSFMLFALFYNSQNEGNTFTSFGTTGLITCGDVSSLLPIKTGITRKSSVTHRMENIWTFSPVHWNTRNHHSYMKFSYLTIDTGRWLSVRFWTQNYNRQWIKSKVSQMMYNFSFRNKMIFPIVWSPVDACFHSWKSKGKGTINFNSWPHME